MHFVVHYMGGLAALQFSVLRMLNLILGWFYRIKRAVHYMGGFHLILG